MVELQPGLYVHYKGGKYLVLFVAHESTNGREGRDVVVYVSLTNNSTHTRDFVEFTEEIVWPDGVTRPRFIRSEP